MRIEINFYLVSIFIDLLIFEIKAISQFQTVKPDYADKLQHLLENQKQLDCQQFDADLIECFAYNLFLKNAHLYRDLESESNSFFFSKFLNYN